MLWTQNSSDNFWITIAVSGVFDEKWSSRRWWNQILVKVQIKFRDKYFGSNLKFTERSLIGKQIDICCNRSRKNQRGLEVSYKKKDNQSKSSFSSKLEDPALARLALLAIPSIFLDFGLSSNELKWCIDGWCLSIASVSAALLVMTIGRLICKSILCGISNVTWTKYLIVIIGDFMVNCARVGIGISMVSSITSVGSTSLPSIGSTRTNSKVRWRSPDMKICVWYKAALGVTFNVVVLLISVFNWIVSPKI